MKSRIVLAVMTIAVTASMLIVMNILPAAAQTSPSASRSFDSAMVDPGGQVVVTINALNLGGLGAVTETLPEGFSYVSSSLDDAQVNVSGQTARFTLQRDTLFTYTVTASSTPGPYSFSGTLRDVDRNDHMVGGDSSISVRAPAQTPPSASRSFDSAMVDPGGQVVVTINALNLGGLGAVTETLPEGFSYVSSSLDAAEVTELGNNQIRFSLQGDTSFTYTVTASSTPGPYSFSGTLRDADDNDHMVGGDSSISVRAPAQTPPSASRSFDSAMVDPGGQVVVTINALNLGGLGAVTETLPEGFSYVSSSLDAAEVTELGNNQIRFSLQGDASFTYTVTASSTPGPYSFSGTLRDADDNDHMVGGDSSISVRAPAQTPPSASRSFDSAMVDPGGQVVVTINALNLGGLGAVTETLPEGFSYVSSSLDDAQVNVSGQTARFTLQRDTLFTYTVTASSTPGPYSFSGTLRDADQNDHMVVGDSSISVRAPEAIPAPVGPRGPRGPEGDRGPKGNSGDPGPKGDTGSKGDQGDPGLKGSTGDTGPKGDQGDPGLKGSTGDTGPKGDQGDPGLKGSTGDTGPKGDQGDPGLKGSTGDTGPKGDQGDPGLKGSTGDTGPKGDQGDPGLKGGTGDTGDTGISGQQGDQGPQGVIGPGGGRHALEMVALIVAILSVVAVAGLFILNSGRTIAACETGRRKMFPEHNLR